MSLGGTGRTQGGFRGPGGFRGGFQAGTRRRTLGVRRVRAEPAGLRRGWRRGQCQSRQRRRPAAATSVAIGRGTISGNVGRIVRAGAAGAPGSGPVIARVRDTRSVKEAVSGTSCVAIAWSIIALKQRVGDGDHRGAVTTARGANVRGERIKATPRFSGAAEAARSVRTRWSGCVCVRWLGQGATPTERLARRGAARAARRCCCGSWPALPGELSERWPAAMLSDINKDSIATMSQRFRCHWVARIFLALCALCASRCLMCSLVANREKSTIKEECNASLHQALRCSERITPSRGRRWTYRWCLNATWH